MFLVDNEDEKFLKDSECGNVESLRVEITCLIGREWIKVIRGWSIL